MTFHEPPSNQHPFKHGPFKMSANGNYLRLVSWLVGLVFLTGFYLLDNNIKVHYYNLIRGSQPTRGSTYFSYMNSSVTSLTRDGYLVWNPSCRIPDISPTHESIRKFVKKLSPIKCGSSLPPLTSTTRDKRLDSHTLHFHAQHLPSYAKSRVSCCYSLVSRKDASKMIHDFDDVYEVGTCKPFNTSVIFTGEEQCIKVKCTITWRRTSKEVYSNVHMITRKTSKVKHKLEKLAVSQDKLSVMLVGIDSISRLNLIRTMPNTVKYLQSNGWLEYKGYNKVDDNTFPNLMAILTGYTVSQVRSHCWSQQMDPFDKCPIVWKDFSERGYVTMYAEDEPTIGTFNYNKAGFFKTPTDYYLRPFMLAAEKFLQHKIINSLKICLGPNLGAGLILQSAIEFATAFRDDPSFSLFWMNSFSHNDLNTPSSFDREFVRFFHDLADTGAFNSTFVIFLSDHGMRFGRIRETYVGWIEERLPYLYFWVPHKYRKSFPKKYNSLVTNRDRLTSAFDLHLTLKDLLGRPANGTEGCPKCRTLFEEVPWNRSCQDVGVTAHWCTCSEYKNLPTESGAVNRMVEFIIKEINSALDNGTQYLKNGTRCAKLQASRVLSVRLKVVQHTMGYEEYIILFETSPNEALFEASIKYKHSFELIDTVSRINAYGSQSQCITHSYLQKYCFCINK